MKTFIAIALGGAIGAVLRYVITYFLGANFKFPFATFTVNIIGSFLVGIAASWLMKQQLNTTQYLFLATGICGGFTSFSAFSLENIRLLQAGNYTIAFLYIASSFILGLLACFLGLKLGR